MNKRWFLMGSVAMLAVISLINAQPVRCDGPSAKDIQTKVEGAYSKLKDMRAELRVAYANDDELRKISEDFARSLGFKKINIALRPPDKLRYESAHISFAKVVIVTRGNMKAVQIPSLHISKKIKVPQEDIGKKQYPIDFGIPCGDLWDDWKVQVKGTDTVDGQPCYVLKLTNPLGDKTESYMELWIDRSLWVPRKLEKIRYNGKIKSRLMFKEYRLIEHAIMVPMRIEIYNVNNKLAGALEYNKVDLNPGLPESDFRIN